MSHIFWNDKGLIAAVAQDVQTKKILVMAWVNTEALIEILTTKKVCYWSRARPALWRNQPNGYYLRQSDYSRQCFHCALCRYPC